MNRRDFLNTAGAAALAAPLVTARAAEADKIKLGLIGCGGYGMANLQAAFRAGGVEVTGLCDVDRDHLEATARKIEELQGARPRTFKHHAELLDLPGLRAVIIATPPQWHALQFIDAVRRDLDVYCEKPLAYDIREGRAMVDAARSSRSVVQIGFQRRQSPAIRQVRDYVQSGKAGRIVQVESQIHYTAGVKDTTPQDPPPGLDWDLWCGPAPKLPYCPQIGHVNWRLEKEYGHGHLVDWGIHLIDAVRLILGEGAPRAVQAAGGLYHFKGRITTPDVLNAHFEFGTCPVTWRHRLWGAAEYSPEVANGIFLYGERETVFVTDDRWVVIPRGNKPERRTHEARDDMGKLQMADFLDAVRTRRAPGCSAADAHVSTTTVKLAMIAYDTASQVVWDAAAEQIVGNPEAARRLKRDYRAPWKHPFPA